MKKTPGQRLTDLGFSGPPSGFEPETYALRVHLITRQSVPTGAVASPFCLIRARLGVTFSPKRIDQSQQARDTPGQVAGKLRRMNFIASSCADAPRCHNSE